MYEVTKGKVLKKTVGLNGPVWNISHCAEYMGVTQQYYRRNILIHDGHPKSINPNSRRWNFWAANIKKWHAELIEG